MIECLNNFSPTIFLIEMKYLFIVGFILAAVHCEGEKAPKTCTGDDDVSSCGDGLVCYKNENLDESDSKLPPFYCLDESRIYKECENENDASCGFGLVCHKNADLDNPVNRLPPFFCMLKRDL